MTPPPPGGRTRPGPGLAADPARPSRRRGGSDRAVGSPRVRAVRHGEGLLPAGPDRALRAVRAALLRRDPAPRSSAAAGRWVRSPLLRLPGAALRSRDPGPAESGLAAGDLPPRAAVDGRRDRPVAAAVVSRQRFRSRATRARKRNGSLDQPAEVTIMLRVSRFGHEELRLLVGCPRKVTALRVGGRMRLPQSARSDPAGATPRRRTFMRGRTRAILAAGFTSVALLATACGGGGTTDAGDRGGGQTGGEITIPAARRRTRSSPAPPARSAAATSSTPWPPSWSTTTPRPPRRQRHRRVDRVHRTTRSSPSNSSSTSSTTAPTSRPRTSSTPGTTPRTGTTARRAATSIGPIEGYADTQCPDEECDAAAEAKTMSGLKVVDDYDLHHQDHPSRCRICRCAWATPPIAPLPDSFFNDPKAFEEKPIGAGPFKMDSSKQHRDRAVQVRRLQWQVQGRTWTS